MLPQLVLYALPASFAGLEPPTDRAIEDAIEYQLRARDEIDAFTVDVQVKAAVATLTGTADSLLAHDRAEDVAMAVRGVRAVVNRIDVEPPHRDDEALERDFKRLLRLSDVTESWEIDGDASGAVLTLRGEVDSWREVEVADRLARGVSGVVDVRNRITYDPRLDRSDGEIRAEVSDALDWHAQLEPGTVDVTVKRGKVRLVGSVASVAQKRLAESLAHVEGVRVVSSRKVKVHPWPSSDRRRPVVPAERSDAEILAAVQDAWRFDPRVQSWTPEATVSDGFVTLRGTVPSFEAFLAAEQDVLNTVGVQGVDNLIRVQPRRVLDPKTLEDSLQSLMDADPAYDDGEVTVSVEDGVVTLTGTVDSPWERMRAVDVASRHHGVIGLHNHLDVKTPPVARAQPVPGGDPIDVPWSDDALRNLVESHLLWSPFVETSDVEVEADAGHVTLTGTVNSWYEKSKAEEAARLAGAESVANALLVAN